MTFQVSVMKAGEGSGGVDTKFVSSSRICFDFLVLGRVCYVSISRGSGESAGQCETMLPSENKAFSSSRHPDL